LGPWERASQLAGAGGLAGSLLGVPPAGFCGAVPFFLVGKRILDSGMHTVFSISVRIPSPHQGLTSKTPQIVRKVRCIRSAIGVKFPLTYPPSDVKKIREYRGSPPPPRPLRIPHRNRASGTVA